VFWIGIGTPALSFRDLFLLRQKWRTSINRAAEAMTLFAVICAAIFPGVHVGRVWMAWFSRRCRTTTASGQTSAARCSGTSSLSRPTSPFRFFLVHGLIPDLATLRDRATTKIKKFLYGIFARRLARSNRNWRHYEMAYLLLGRSFHAARSLRA
jgi:molybdopterin-containing oxidoreductase family membrane subunit